MVNLKCWNCNCNIKCYKQKLYMANHPKENSSKSKSTADKDVATIPEESENAVSIAYAFNGVPLAAKDSEWIGLKSEFVRTKSNVPTEYLFPGVKFSDNSESTTVLTKLLVGRKANFNNLPTKPEKLLKQTNKLCAVQEQPKEEEFHPSDTDISAGSKQPSYHQSASDIEHYDDDDDEPIRATHTKRRKKRSDIKVITEDVSSVSILPTVRVRRQSGSRMRHTDPAKTKQLGVNTGSIVLSNDADDEYMTQSEENCGNDKQLPKI